MFSVQIQGRRQGYARGAALFLAIGASALGAILFAPSAYPEGLIMALLGAPMGALGLDNAARALWPNRLVFSSTGFQLKTIYGDESWHWDAFVGVRGTRDLLLDVRRPSGKIRTIPIGHWPHGLARQFHAFAKVARFEARSRAQPVHYRRRVANG